MEKDIEFIVLFNKGKEVKEKEKNFKKLRSKFKRVFKFKNKDSIHSVRCKTLLRHKESTMDNLSEKVENKLNELLLDVYNKDLMNKVLEKKHSNEEIFELMNKLRISEDLETYETQDELKYMLIKDIEGKTKDPLSSLELKDVYTKWIEHSGSYLYKDIDDLLNSLKFTHMERVTTKGARVYYFIEKNKPFAILDLSKLKLIRTKIY